MSLGWARILLRHQPQPCNDTWAVFPIVFPRHRWGLIKAISRPHLHCYPKGAPQIPNCRQSRLLPQRVLRMSGQRSWLVVMETLPLSFQNSLTGAASSILENDGQRTIQPRQTQQGRIRLQTGLSGEKNLLIWLLRVDPGLMATQSHNQY